CLFFIPAYRDPPSVHDKKSDGDVEQGSVNADQPKSSVKKKAISIMEWSSMKEFPWDVILLFGGGFALAEAVKDSGLTNLIADQLKAFSVVPYIIMIGIVSAAVTLVTGIASNVATIQIFLPILASLSIAVGVHPMLLMMP